MAEELDRIEESKDFRSEVALNNIYLSRAIKQIEFAETNSLLGQLGMAIENLDHAWADMPKNARQKVTMPSEQVQIKLAKVQSDREMLRWKQYQRMSPTQRQRQRNSEATEISKELVRDIKIQILDALFDAGYLMSGVMQKNSFKDLAESIIE